MHLLYDGPSQLDNKPIFAVATGLDYPSRNPKTGPVIQTYILTKSTTPIEAIKTEQDKSICGTCPLKGGKIKKRSCYVNIGHTPTRLWKAFLAGNYSEMNPKHLGRGRKIRLGSYGDPAAIPTKIWKDFTKYATGWVGYTRQWETCDPDLNQFCMASVETLQEAEEANLKGWKTFRITTDLNSRTKNEIRCPAKPGFMTCYQCMACNGTSQNVLIKVHGIKPKIQAFEEQYGNTILINQNKEKLPEIQNVKIAA